MSIYKKEDNWFIDFRNNGQRIRKKIGPNKKQAVLALDKIKVQIAENKFLDVRKNGKILLSDMANEYLERYSRINKRSSKRDELSIRTFLRFFKSLKLNQVTPLLIEDYKAKRRNEGVAFATINRELACLKHIYSKAVEWGKVSDNPVKKVKLFKENNQRVRFLEKADVKRLVECSSDFLKPVLITALNTGMRQGEILDLQWPEVNLVREIITVVDSKNKERRYIPINKVLKDVFLWLKSNAKRSKYVFSNAEGQPLTKNGKIRKEFVCSLLKADIKDFRFHDLRHTFASQLVMSAVDIITVKELLGHKTLAMTLRYSHLSPNFKKKAVELLSSKVDTFWTLGVKQECELVSA